MPLLDLGAQRAVPDDHQPGVGPLRWIWAKASIRSSGDFCGREAGDAADDRRVDAANPTVGASRPGHGGWPKAVQFNTAANDDIIIRPARYLAPVPSQYLSGTPRSFCGCTRRRCAPGLHKSRESGGIRSWKLQPWTVWTMTGTRAILAQAAAIRPKTPALELWVWTMS
jgi:hypothetical protein